MKTDKSSPPHDELDPSIRRLLELDEATGPSSPRPAPRIPVPADGSIATFPDSPAEQCLQWIEAIRLTSPELMADAFATVAGEKTATREPANHEWAGVARTSRRRDDADRSLPVAQATGQGRLRCRLSGPRPEPESSGSAQGASARSPHHRRLAAGDSCEKPRRRRHWTTRRLFPSTRRGRPAPSAISRPPSATEWHSANGWNGAGARWRRNSPPA